MSGDTHRLNKICLELDTLETLCQGHRTHHVILLFCMCGIFPIAKLWKTDRLSHISWCWFSRKDEDERPWRFSILYLALTPTPTGRTYLPLFLAWILTPPPTPPRHSVLIQLEPKVIFFFLTYQAPLKTLKFCPPFSEETAHFCTAWASLCSTSRPWVLGSVLFQISAS